MCRSWSCVSADGVAVSRGAPCQSTRACIIEIQYLLAEVYPRLPVSRIAAAAVSSGPEDPMTEGKRGGAEWLWTCVGDQLVVVRNLWVRCQSKWGSVCWLWAVQGRPARCCSWSRNLPLSAVGSGAVCACPLLSTVIQPDS